MQRNLDSSTEIFYSGQRRILDFYGMWPQTERWKRLLLRVHFWHIFVCWILVFDLILALRIALNISHMNEVIKGFFVLSTCIAYTLKVCQANILMIIY